MSMDISRRDALKLMMNMGVATFAGGAMVASRSVFAQQATFAIPPFAAGAIDALQKDGVLFCACNMAVMHFSMVTGGKINVDKDAAYAEWKANLLPGITLVPSGVAAVGRAQAHQCAYCGT